MAAITVPGSVPALPPWWAVPLFALAVTALWLVTFEGGPASHALGQAGSFLHEVFHDGRHLIGVPCH